MATLTFIGVGNMGGPMARRLLAAGHKVRVFDRDLEAAAALGSAGAVVASGIGDAVAGASAIFTMLPARVQVEAVYLGRGEGSGPGLVDCVAADTLLVDCSTIEPAVARHVAQAAQRRQLEVVDAPVSGGVVGAEAGTLTFMVGGSDQAVARARPLLEAMGKNIVHTGGSGTGQAAKICNNLILGVSMIGVSEAFNLADQLGLERQKLFDVSATSSGQCWALTTYCPVPGPVPTSPANRDYAAGFAAAMMLKDLKLAQASAAATNTATPLANAATQLYQLLTNQGLGKKDFSVIIKMLQGNNWVGSE